MLFRSFFESAEAIRLRSAVRVPPRVTDRILPIFQNRKYPPALLVGADAAAPPFARRISIGRAVTAPPLYRSFAGFPQKSIRRSPTILCEGRRIMGSDGDFFVRRAMGWATASGGLRDQSLKNPLFAHAGLCLMAAIEDAYNRRRPSGSDLWPGGRVVCTYFVYLDPSVDSRQQRPTRTADLCRPGRIDSAPAHVCRHCRLRTGR